MALLTASSTQDTGMLRRSWICFALLALCLRPPHASAKPDSLKEVTDANWEDILTGEWMIEL